MAVWRCSIKKAIKSLKILLYSQENTYAGVSSLALLKRDSSTDVLLLRHF